MSKADNLAVGAYREYKRLWSRSKTSKYVNNFGWYDREAICEEARIPLL